VISPIWSEWSATTRKSSGRESFAFWPLAPVTPRPLQTGRRRPVPAVFPTRPHREKARCAGGCRRSTRGSDKSRPLAPPGRRLPGPRVPGLPRPGQHSGHSHPSGLPKPMRRLSLSRVDDVSFSKLPYADRVARCASSDRQTSTWRSESNCPSGQRKQEISRRPISPSKGFCRRHPCSDMGPWGNYTCPPRAPRC
jgi:hypothetical protein